MLTESEKVSITRIAAGIAICYALFRILLNHIYPS